jgi:molybdopterin synthase catalytic subunit
MITARIQTAALDSGAQLSALLARASPDGGAVASFAGVVRRDEKKGILKKVDAMTLEHYPGMTEKMLSRIAQTASERWQLKEALVIHRVGRIAAGEAIVFVGVVAAHREAAFAACSFIVDYLKTRAPFWKREHADSGDAWVAARAADDKAVARWEAKSEAADR